MFYFEGFMMKWIFKGVKDYCLLFILWVVQFALIDVIAFRIFDTTSPYMSVLITWIITTMSIMFMGLNAMSSVMARVSNSHQKEIDKLEEEKKNLNNLIRDQKEKINTMEQTQSFVPQIKGDIKLQAFTITKSGYVVKQEKLADLIDHPDYITTLQPKSTIPIVQEVNQWVRRYMGKNNRQVFYVGKHINQYAVGINLKDVMYSVDVTTGKVTFYKLELSVLDRTILKPDEERQASHNAINHTWIIYNDDNKDIYNIENARKFTAFKNKYAEWQRYIVAKSIETETENLCKKGTEGLQTLLRSVYGDKIEFFNEGNIEETSTIKYSLIDGVGNDKIAIRLIADLMIALKAINLYASNTDSLDKALISEQASA